MAIRPEDALAASPAAQWSAEELADLQECEGDIDELLAGHFDGIQATISLEKPHRFIAEIVRRFIVAGWQVAYGPTPGRVAPARQQQVDLSTITNFTLVFVPTWERVQRAALTVRSPRPKLVVAHGG